MCPSYRYTLLMKLLPYTLTTKKRRRGLVTRQNFKFLSDFVFELRTFPKSLHFNPNKNLIKRF